MLTTDHIADTVSRQTDFDTAVALTKPSQRHSFEPEVLRGASSGDGITTINTEEMIAYETAFEMAAATGKIRKLLLDTPSETKLFDFLKKWLAGPHSMDGSSLSERAQNGDPSAIEVREFMAAVRNLAFAKDLRQLTDGGDRNLDMLLEDENFAAIALAILHEDGLNYDCLPVSLQKTCWHNGSPVTGLEKQLLRSAATICDSVGQVRMTLLCPQQFFDDYRRLLKLSRARFENPRQRFQVNIIAGHDNGQACGPSVNILKHLQAMNGDIVFIQDFQHPLIATANHKALRFQKALGGLLVELQQRIHFYLNRMVGDYVDSQLLSHMLDFTQRRLGIHLPEWADNGSKNDKIEFLINRLNRPIRVCGVVPRPWRDEELVWMADQEGVQKLRWQKSGNSHSRKAYSFTTNMVCGLRGFRGRQFDLIDYSAMEASDNKVSDASFPQKWDNMMGEWLTVYVELPPQLFGRLTHWTDLESKVEGEPAAAGSNNRQN